MPSRLSIGLPVKQRRRKPAARKGSIAYLMPLINLSSPNSGMRLAVLRGSVELRGQVGSARFRQV